MRVYFEYKPFVFLKKTHRENRLKNFRSCCIGINRFWLVRLVGFYHVLLRKNLFLVDQLFQPGLNQDGPSEKALEWLCRIIVAHVRTIPFLRGTALHPKAVGKVSYREKSEAYRPKSVAVETVDPNPSIIAQSYSTWTSIRFNIQTACCTKTKFDDIKDNCKRESR